ncbi:hypothetical protein GJ496_006427 [Pomphorhynchus laevis]|nr:hypothetical protein GJ496_006427 [Pomphorhynchus laevis]
MANESDRVRKRKLKTQHIQSTSHFTENLNESRDKFFNFRTFLQRILLLTLILIAFYRVYFSQWPFDKNTITRPVKLPSALSYLKSQHNILDDELFWGTYRPNLYFGVRHRSPVSIIGGLAWYNEYQLRKEGPAKFRHFCQNQDGVYNYGWFAHDGKHVGIQNISDTQFTVQTTWVKQTNAKNSWAAKIQVFPEFKDLNSHESVVALMFYFTYASQWIDRINYNDNEHSLLIQGHTPELGYFKILIRQIKQSYSFPVSSYTLSDSGDVRFGLPLVRHLKQVDRFIKLSASNDEMPNRNTRSIIFHTNCLEYPCELMISFHSDEDQPISTRTEFKHLLQTHMKNFDLKFKNIFPQAAESGMSEMYKYLLSNMLGGMGYFHGQAKVQKDSDTSFRRYWPASLFSAVPSRSVFPRGFMWDEAFHHLLISRWDRQLSVEVLAYYLDMMNADGWMPREIILGYESEFHVPSEFVIQHNSHANPPAWILTVDHLLTMKNSSDELEYWNRTVDRLKHWLKWFQSTQHGKIKGSFRWRGRNSSSVSELNSKTLTSGLDDYPRASHPTDDERHVDLFCWLLYAERVMKQHFNLDVNLTLNGFSGLKNLHYYDHAFRDYGLKITHSGTMVFTRKTFFLNQYNKSRLTIMAI